MFRQRASKTELCTIGAHPKGPSGKRDVACPQRETASVKNLVNDVFDNIPDLRDEAASKSFGFLALCGPLMAIFGIFLNPFPLGRAGG